MANIRHGREEQGLNEWVPGYRASNRAYLHDVRHHGPQLSEGPTQNRQNCDVNRVLRHPSVRLSVGRARALSVVKRTWSPSRFRIYSPVAFMGAYWASWGAMIRPASDKSDTRTKDHRGNQPIGRVVRH